MPFLGPLTYKYAKMDLKMAICAGFLTSWNAHNFGTMSPRGRRSKQPPQLTGYSTKCGKEAQAELSQLIGHPTVWEERAQDQPPQLTGFYTKC